MIRTYEHHGFTVEVSITADFAFQPTGRQPARSRYAAIVSVSRSGQVVATFSPLRFDVSGGRPFDTEVDALMGGYSAGRRIVENLFERTDQTGEELA
jgi:hypothetical protein